MITYIKNQIAEHKKFWSDCKFMFWLFKVMIICFFKGDLDGSQEAWCFIKIHWNYKSTRINQVLRSIFYEEIFMSSFQETIQKIIDDIDARDFKNCKKDCYSANCKYMEECSQYHYKHSEEFSFEDLMEGIRESLKNKVNENVKLEEDNYDWDDIYPNADKEY